MRECERRKACVGAALAFAALLALPAHARIEQNKTAAFLVFPYVAAESSGETGRTVETLLTLTNTSPQPYRAHVVFINGNEVDPQYCYECGFDISVVGMGTNTILVSRSSGVTLLRDLLTGDERACTATKGFVTVDVEAFDYTVLSDNVLLGNSVTVDYTSGSSVNLEALPVQGQITNGDRQFAFDEFEYRKFPSAIAADFIVPSSSPTTGIGADLVLFTLGFQSRFPPSTDCSITGFDAAGELMSTTIQFGCWARRALRDIDPEFTYPHFGAAGDAAHEHGNLFLSCTVLGTGPNPQFDGGVHGLILQSASSGTLIRRNVPGPAVSNAVQWGRVLAQSSTVGDGMVLQIDPAPLPAPGGPQP